MEMLPCGGRAYRDPSCDELSYRCTQCMAVIGSMGQPRYCQELMEEQNDILDADRAAAGDPE